MSGHAHVYQLNGMLGSEPCSGSAGLASCASPGCSDWWDGVWRLTSPLPRLRPGPLKSVRGCHALLAQLCVPMSKFLCRKYTNSSCVPTAFPLTMHHHTSAHFNNVPRCFQLHLQTSDTRDPERKEKHKYLSMVLQQPIKTANGDFSDLKKNCLGKSAQNSEISNISHQILYIHLL